MANRIPREFIQEILARINIVELIDNRIPLQKKSTANYFACCPFHTEKSASFSVSQNKQFYYCFGCGAHGNAIDFLIQYDRLNFTEAVEAIAKIVGLEVPKTTSQSIQVKIAPDLYTLLDKVAQFYQTNLRTNKVAIDYLKQRGLTGEIAREFNLGFAPAGWDNLIKNLGNSAALRQQLHETGMLVKKDDGQYHDRFRERIMFPIRDRRGRIIGFGGRIIDQGEPKYLNSPETPLFHKGRELYGLYNAEQANRKLNQVLIVEGYMDVISLFQHGINYAVATLGTATSANHLQRLFRHTSQIIFCFDGDQAGRTAAWRALQVAFPIIQDGQNIKFMFLPNGDDPDSFVRKIGREQFEQQIQSSMPLSQFFFQSLSAQVDLSHLDGRAQLAKLAIENINQLPEGIFKRLMLDELEKRTHLSPNHFKTPEISTKNKTAVNKSRPTSALKLTLMLLVQQPQLATLITTPLPSTEGPGFNLLHNLLEIIQQYPDITTGGLLEHWRERSDSELLIKLAGMSHMIPTNGIEKEFIGAINCLFNQNQKQLIAKLLAKAADASLTADEKIQLHKLIADKQKEVTG